MDIFLAKQHLATFSPNDIRQLATFFKLRGDDPNDLLWMLAINIHSKYNYRALMPPEELPYSGDLSKAIAAQDRPAIRAIMAWRQQYKPLSLTAEVETYGCTNERDHFTNEEWTSPPDVKIKFIDPIRPEVKPYVLCLSKDSLEGWVADKDNFYARWVKKPLANVIDDSGHGGEPFLGEKYLKLPDGTYIASNPFAYDYNKGNIELVGVPVEQRVRVGNLRGTFGVSEIHGQEPGMTVYKIIPLDENMDGYGNTPWTRDILTKNQMIADKVPGDWDNKDIQLYFQISVVHGNIRRVKLLLADSRVDPTADNNLAIQVASENGNAEVVKLLLADSRVDPTVDNNFAIRIASEHGHTEVVKLLLAHTRPLKYVTEHTEEMCLAAVRHGGRC